MDMNWIPAIMRLLMVLVFAGIYWWAFSKSRKPSFDEAANLPFIDEQVERQANLEKGTQL